MTSVADIYHLLPCASNIISSPLFRPSISVTVSLHPPSSSSLKCNFQQQIDFQIRQGHDIVGDCVVYDDCAFEDSNRPTDSGVFPVEHGREKFSESRFLAERARRRARPKSQNLVPEGWQDELEALYVTKKERLEFERELKEDTRLNKKKREAMPLQNVSVSEYMKIRRKVLSRFNPDVLDNPTPQPGEEKKEEPVKNPASSCGFSGSRVTPRDPRREVYGRTMDDVSEFFKSEAYTSSCKSGVARGGEQEEEFTAEEMQLMNAMEPNLRAAAGGASGNWLPLHSLAASGEFYHMNLLLKSAVDVNAADKSGVTALHRAVMGRQLTVLHFLLRLAADPFVLDNDGATILHYATLSSSLQAIKILLLYAVNINSPDHDGWTPLHLAVQARNVTTVKLLLTRGADRSLRNKDGLTALDMCLHFGRSRLTYYLIWILKVYPGSSFSSASTRVVSSY